MSAIIQVLLEYALGLRGRGGGGGGGGRSGGGGLREPKPEKTQLDYMNLDINKGITGDNDSGGYPKIPEASRFNDPQTYIRALNTGVLDGLTD